MASAACATSVRQSAAEEGGGDPRGFHAWLLILLWERLVGTLGVGPVASAGFKGGKKMARLGRLLRVLVFGQHLFHAQTDMLAENPLGFGGLSPANRLQNAAMKGLDLGQQLGRVMLAAQGKDANEQARVGSSLGDALVAGRLQQEDVEAIIRQPHPLQQVAGEPRLAALTRRARHWPISPTSPSKVSRCLRPIPCRAALPTAYTSRASRSSYNSTMSRRVGSTKATPRPGICAEHALGDQLADGLADGGAADADFLGQGDFAQGRRL